jgi:ribulose-phosphate 3-epimerase
LLSSILLLGEVTLNISQYLAGSQPAGNEVDGGVTLENKEQLIEAGANIIVAGSSIINAKDYKDVINKIKE